MNLYTASLAPLDLGHVVLKNRFMMGSMHTGLEEAENGYARMAAFYAERAAGGAALIVTGGVSPNNAGKLGLGEAERNVPESAHHHRIITDAVHEHDGRILLQLLHAGRYSKHAAPVAPSALQAPITRHMPRALEAAEIEQTIVDFAVASAAAQDVGYDGVEIMGSEGYLISQFLAARTNQRDDDWGGDWQRRKRFATEVVGHARQRVGPNFIIMFRISVLELVEGGMTGEEIVDLARSVEAAGASMLDSGIGWHEARIPTIMGAIPHGGFRWATRRVKEAVSIPVVACNRINHPDTAEQIIGDGDADMVSMARPWLADANFVRHVATAEPEKINTCIACNQACLDLIFGGVEATCLVNPRACRETKINSQPAPRPKRIAVIGGGPGGMSCTATLAERGHKVTLYEAHDRLGGQFNMASVIPGKADYAETVRYFSKRITDAGVDIQTGRVISAAELIDNDFDEFVIATGVTPRVPEIDGIDHASVLTYTDVLLGGKAVGERVAIIGAGGIGFDVAEFLLGDSESDIEHFNQEWSIDMSMQSVGGLLEQPVSHQATREVYLCQRSSSRFGRGLGKSTGWALRAGLERKGLKLVGAVTYLRIDDAGLHINDAEGDRLLEVDNIIVCAGQLERRELVAPLKATGKPVHLIGGADVAAELDAKRAIEQGTLLGIAS
jgi:2,4-dienoyl-CoA reductase (NADPH2)